jgi:hypothetical protein
MGGWMVNATPRPLYPAWKRPALLVREAEWASGPVWTGAENLSTPPPSPVRFEPMTVQPVASRYTDCAIPPAVCRPKYPLKIQFLPHRKQTISNTKTNLLECTHYWPVRGGRQINQPFLLLIAVHVLYNNIFCFNVKVWRPCCVQIM